jgi:hypothetical protein
MPQDPLFVAGFPRDLLPYGPSLITKVLGFPTASAGLVVAGDRRSWSGLRSRAPAARPACRHGAVKNCAPRRDEGRQLDALQAISVFPEEPLQRRHVQHRFRQKLFQAPVLVLERLQALST